jgi:CRP-like cAMP-binding protein
MSNSNLIDSLKKSKIFRGFTDDELNIVSISGSLETLDSNNIFLNEGETPNFVYIIIRGHVEVFLPKKIAHTNKERVTRVKLCDMIQGDCLGEYSLIDNNPASASAITLEPSELFKISKRSFDEIINSNDKSAKKIYHNILLILIKRARDYDKELDMCYYFYSHLSRLS